MTLLEKIRRAAITSYKFFYICIVNLYAFLFSKPFWFDYYEYKITRLREKLRIAEIKRNTKLENRIINRSVEVWNRINSDTKQDVV